MTNKTNLSEFAGLELDLPKIELPEPSVDISSADINHDHHSDIESDDEGAMVKADLYKLAKYSVKLFKKIEDEDQFESWVQAKITKAADYISSVYHYLEYEMKFSEYGDKIENSDMYSESEKKQMKNALMEARKTLAALKIEQAEKLGGSKVDESIHSHTCGECGGTGMVERPIPEKVKELVGNYNRKTKAFAAAKNRIDKNHNGIPDDQESDVDGEQFDSKPKKASKPKGENPFAKKESDSEPKADSAPKKPKKEKAETDDSKTESFYGGSVYGESAIKRAKNEWKSAKELMKLAEAKKAKKDYDKDGKIETGEEEHKGAVDNAIKASKKEKECMNESVELSRLRELTSRVIL